MHVIKEGLEMMDMDIEINSGGALDNHKNYSKNTFIIFSKSSVNTDTK